MNQKLEEFKRMILFKTHPEIAIEDYQLVKFIQARTSLQESEKMLFDSLEWRKRVKVHEIVTNFSYPEQSLVNQIYPRYCHKTDKLGRLLVINEMGALDMKKLLKCTTEERFITEHIREIEKMTKYRMVACYAKNPASERRIFNIIDLKKVSLSVFPSVRHIIQEIARIDSDYYPETLGCMAIINAPYLFTAIWSIIRLFLDANTIAKIHILGSDYKKSLLTMIDKENLPSHLGGNCTCDGGCKNSDTGPWNDGTVLGFPQPFWESFKSRDAGLLNDESTL